MRSLLLAAFLLVPAVSSSALTFAQVALGGGYEATLLVTNKKLSPWTGELRPYQGMNKVWATTWSVNGSDYTGRAAYPLSLAPKESVKVVIRGDGITKSGYLDLVSTGSNSSYEVAVSYFYGYYSGTQLQDTVGSPFSDYSKKWTVPVEIGFGIDTGLAWCPASRYNSTTYPITVQAYNTSGSLVLQTTVTFDGHKAQFVSQMLPTLPKTFSGQIYLEAAEYFHLEVLRLESTTSGFQLTSSPPDSYIP
jgi:hypothetical protein